MRYKITEKSLKYVVVFGLTMISIGYCIAAMIFNHPVDYYQILDKFYHKPKPDHRYILLWTSFFENDSWYLSDRTTLREDFFKKAKCPQTACTITTDRKILDEVTDYDAILFHGAEIWTSRTHKLPLKRDLRQYYVLGIQESPAHSRHEFQEQKYFFNWTMTYRLDSDVPYPYGLVRDIVTHEVVAPKPYVNWRKTEEYFDEDLLRIVLNKKKKVAWFVSHCETHSRREILAKKLGRFIPIDVFGKCGNLECHHQSKVHVEDSCSRMLTAEYKFYLSFENALCQDYVTEKLYNALQEVIIPIVFGGANYSKFAPPGSYIDANDFKTPMELAGRINFLDANPKEYLKYFWWRTYYYIPLNPAPSIEAFCQLCINLHNPNIDEVKTVYGDIQKWWFNGMCVNMSRINIYGQDEAIHVPKYF